MVGNPVSRRNALSQLAAVTAVSVTLAACERHPEPAKPNKKPDGKHPAKRKRVHHKRKAGFKRQGAVLQTTFRSVFIVDSRKSDPAKRIRHYADAQGRVFGLDGRTKIASFRAYDPTQDAGAALSKFRLRFTAEKAALECFTADANGAITPSQEQCARACGVLLDAIARIAAKQNGRPPYRLFDLAGGIAYRAGLRDVLARLKGMAWPGADKTFVVRQRLYQAALDDLSGAKPLGGAKHMHAIARWNRHVREVAWGTFALSGGAKGMRTVRFGDMV